MSDSNNKRIAKNSIFLYIRMFFTLAIGLFTSRIVLQALGIDDYGIYNVVGGVVVAFSFLNMSLTNASSRFYSATIAKNDISLLNKTSNCVISIHYILAFIVFILIETIGLWILFNKLTIPSDSKVASLWVFQCSTLTMIINIISVPYNAMIISHERMNAFAIVSIIESCSKLIIAYILFQFSDSTRLIAYAVMLVVSQLCIRFLYTYYCRKHFVEAKFKWEWDNTISIPILKFAGWTMNGNLAVIGYTQGINILLNIYFGPAVNAARGIAVQIQSAVRQFFMSFQTAINPQIIKSYAKGDLTYMHDLIILGSKYSYFLILAIALPIMLNVNYLLGIWLTRVPPYTASFMIIMLCVCLINTLATPLNYGIHATGHLKKFQLIEGGILLSVVPLAWIGLKYFNINPIQVFIIYLIIEFITQIARIIIVCDEIELNKILYFKRVILRIFFTTIIAIPIPIIFSLFYSGSFIPSILSFLICEMCICISIWVIGIRTNERNYIKTKIKKFIK